MGTPGDKAKIGKVVLSEQSQLDPDQGNNNPPPATTPALTTSTATITTLAASISTRSDAPGVPEFTQPSISTSTTSEMGMISRLPQFETFAALNIHPSLSQAAPKSEGYQAGLDSLEQAHIEDYFAQSKYYPTVSENLQTLAPSAPPRAPAKATFLGPSEPGPSGLQTPKAKQWAKLSVKKTKKQSAQQHQQKKTHTCNICQKNFVSLEKLNKHQQVHSGASPFKCEHCKKSFSSKFKLVRHVLIHSDRKPFSCSICERTFHRKDHLKNHLKIHSPSKKIYVCEKTDCKKEYTSLMSYRKHLALHAAEEGSLQCQICSSTFETKEEILHHLKIHAGSRTVKNPNEKKFNCEYCDRKFFTKKDVRRHLVVHTGMRDFLCQFCPQRFGRKDHLVRHIKKSHSKNLPPEETETAIKSEIPETITKPETTVKPELAPSSSSSSSITPIKAEMDIKAEFSETSLSNPEQFGDFSLEDVSKILEQESFVELLERETEGTLSSFLPSTSSQIELRDLGSTILDDIEEPVVTPPLIMEEGLANPEEEIVSRSAVYEIQRLLEPSEEEENLRLPGFSQTFQPPPQPPP